MTAAPHVLGAGRWDPPGVTFNGDGTANVSLWAAGADAVELCVFGAGGETRLALPGHIFDVFTGTVAGLIPGTEYGFRVHGPWDPMRGLRWNPSKLLMDPYARALTGQLSLDHAIFGHSDDDLVFNSSDSAPFVPRSVVTASTFEWDDDAPPRTPWSRTIVYEAHVRGLTMRHPEVPEHERGTYAGLAHPAVIAHMHSLGVTAVELLPVHHFVDEVHLLRAGLRNYWGYNTVGYFAPHASYASSGTHGQQIDEFKAMVKAMHAAGLEVILDVVYNHTAEAGADGPTLSWRGIANPEYYHLFDGGRRYANDTGCGNTYNSSSPRGLQLVLDSLRYWVREMHVDGFRFDLATTLARGPHGVDVRGTFMSALLADHILRDVKLIAEPWDVGPDGYQVGRFPPPWHEWNDRYRDCVRDFWRGSGSIGSLGWRLTGSSDLFGADGRRPFASVNFVTAHDGFTLRDLVTYNTKHNEANGEHNRDGTDDNRSCNYGIEGETDDRNILATRRRQMRNLLATLAFSTGVPMLLAGDEMGRTQHGNNNAYCQDGPMTWVDWDLEPWQEELLAFTRRVFALRREQPVFRLQHFFAGRSLGVDGVKDLTWIAADGSEVTDALWHDPGVRTIGLHFAGASTDADQGSRDPDVPLLLILHAGADPVDFVLPSLGTPAFEVLLRTDQDSDEPAVNRLVVAAGTVLPLAERSLVLLGGHRA